MSKARSQAEILATARLTPEQRGFLAAHGRAFRAHLRALGDPVSPRYCGLRGGRGGHLSSPQPRDAERIAAQDGAATA